MSENKAKEIFYGIFDRGTQWEIAEVNNEHIPIDKIDRYDDWMSYGNNQDKAAKIFNDLKIGWKVIKVDDYTGGKYDYFNNTHDFDEYNIDIREVEGN